MAKPKVPKPRARKAPAKSANPAGSAKPAEALYRAEDIRVLNWREGLRMRPAMYVGSTGAKGIHHMVWELVGNVVDLHLSRLATTIYVDVTNGWVTVRDDGPGIPSTILPTVCTRLHAGATFDGHLPHVHVTSTLHGVGLAAVNGLSSQFEIETTYEGHRWRQTFARGLQTSDLKSLGPTTVEGTTVRFRPDPEIFSRTTFDSTAIHSRLEQLAWLNPLLRVFFQEQRIFGRGGVRGWATALASARGAVEGIFSTQNSCDGVVVDLALAWSGTHKPVIRSFVNMAEAKSGTHIDGLWPGLASYAESVDAASSLASVNRALSPGLIAIIHVGLLHPRWGNPTKEHLVSPEAGAAVDRVVKSDLREHASRDGRLQSFLRERLGGR